MARMESTYSTASSTRYGVSSAFAAAQSPLETHFWMMAMTFWMNSEGIDETIEAKRMHATASGASTG